ncbi:hypothetical protein BV22DRAFT_1029330 [Leucogyrophana mollusca]|uniref:Uncharacterized protein n=1 Tax=Leucogyrophana mollusca TaxID=85980 RepID=A0ACB8BVG2_9AGAM|nr:hypothetical protein BV22DRAFT_1029330 [Leucogyrophana mollusca]
MCRLRYASWLVQIDYDHLKGYNQVESKRLVTNSRPLDRSENVALEIGPIIICLFLLRGAFYHNDIESLLSDGTFELKTRPEFDELPLFRKAKSGGYGVHPSLPMRAGSMGTCMRKICSILKLSTSSCLRRGDRGGEEDTWGAASTGRACAGSAKVCAEEGFR